MTACGRTRHDLRPPLRRLDADQKAGREAFGWAKTVAGLREMRHRDLPKVDW